jgi:hypothetical protein
VTVLWRRREAWDRKLYNLEEYKRFVFFGSHAHCEVKKYLTNILAQINCTAQECGCDAFQASFKVFSVVQMFDMMLQHWVFGSQHFKTF